MKRIVIIMLFVLLCGGCGNKINNENKNIDLNITATEIYEAIETNEYLVVDVRSKEEYESGHIPNAINIPFNKIDAMNFNYPKDTKIVVYCRSGNRSSNAKKTLKTLGYEMVYDFGAITNYSYELEK